MTPPFFATYGNKENSHSMLTWGNPEVKIPGILAGLTDMQPGMGSLGEQWWPSVGCSPVGDLWALWWTEQDTTAPRAGMVRSKVALWPRDEVGAILDLTPWLQQISGKSIDAPPESMLLAVAQALIFESNKPPIVTALSFWPGILTAIWKQFWPSLREQFSARVVALPLESSHEGNSPVLLGVPPKHVPKWNGHYIIKPDTVYPETAKVAKWLVDKKNTLIDEILSSFVNPPNSLSSLVKTERITNKLEFFLSNRSPEVALSIIRTLSSIEAVSLDARVYADVFKAFANFSQSVSFEFIFSLRNIEAENLPQNKALVRSLENWLCANFNVLTPHEDSLLIDILHDTHGALDWWNKAVKQALNRSWSSMKPAQSERAFYILARGGNYFSTLDEIFPVSKEIETCLVEGADKSDIAIMNYKNIALYAAAKQYSRLNAVFLMKTESPDEALNKQMAFLSNPQPGLAYLVEKLDGKVVISYLLKYQAMDLLPFIAERTKKNPTLLLPLSVKNSTWRRLWRAHISAGGRVWPKTVESLCFSELVEVIISGEDSFGLEAIFLNDLPPFIFTSPNRAQVWDKLANDIRENFLEKVAICLLAAMNTSEQCSPPEPPLQKAIANLIKSTPEGLKPKGLLAALEWGILDDNTTKNVIERVNAQGFLSVGVNIGKYIQKNQWKKSAQTLNERAKKKIEFKAAALECQQLLPFLKRFFSKDSLSSKDAKLLMTELGAELFTDRLEHLWVRAGGEKKNLPSASATYASQWGSAISMAANGGLPGGLFSLVNIMLEELPHNENLQMLSHYHAQQRHK